MTSESTALSPFDIGWQSSDHWTVFDYTFTFWKTNIFGCFAGIMAQFERVNPKMKLSCMFLCVAFKSHTKWSNVQMTQFYQQQPVAFKGWTAFSHVIYAPQKTWTKICHPIRLSWRIRRLHLSRGIRPLSINECFEIYADCILCRRLRPSSSTSVLKYTSTKQTMQRVKTSLHQLVFWKIRQLHPLQRDMTSLHQRVSRKIRRLYPLERAKTCFYQEVSGNIS